tara:strand:- start:185 stop:724 length:540 start_codon:yes stop_codon:yes gene_type:complete
MSLDIKQNIIQHIVYEFISEFDTASTVDFIKKYSFERNGMLTTFFDTTDILKKQELFDLNKQVNSVLEMFTQQVLKKQNFNITHSWLQAYSKKDSHNLHVHGSDHNDYSLILYIQCTENSASTTFFSPGHPYIESPEINIKPEKNKFVIFSGSMPHQVGPNNDDERIVLSLNFQVDKTY